MGITQACTSNDGPAFFVTCALVFLTFVLRTNVSKTNNDNNMLHQEEIVMEILRWLPVKTLIRFKCASKSLRDMITSPWFAKLRNSKATLLYYSKSKTAVFLGSCNLDHPQRPLLPLDIHPDVLKHLNTPLKRNMNPISNKGVCNGVVWFATSEKFILYNPTTRAYRQIRTRVASKWGIMIHLLVGYDFVDNDFKLFTFSYNHIGDYNYLNDYRICFSSLKHDSWSVIDSRSQDHLPVPNNNNNTRNKNNNNPLYWFGGDGTFPPLYPKVAWWFDLSSQRYKTTPIPKELESFRILGLSFLEGRIHIIGANSKKFDIWMVTEEDDCWSLLFSCCSSEIDDWNYFRRPMCYYYSRDGHRIIVIASDGNHTQRLLFCDLETQTINMVQIRGVPEGDYDGVFMNGPLVESFAPLS